jgi:hypothetical protein
MYNSYSNTPRSGLVGEWLFDEGVGITTSDTSGTGNANSGATYSTNISGEIQANSVMADFTALGNSTSSLRVWTGGEVDGGFFNATISTSTFLGATLSNIKSCNAGAGLTTDSSGNIGCGASGTTYTATYPVTLTGSAFGLAFGTTSANTWSQLQTLTLGLNAQATSTIGDGTQVGGLTISGGATTTGNQYIAGTLGIGTKAPVASKENINTSSQTALRIDNSQNDKYLDLFTSGSERFSVNYTSAGTLELQSFGGAKMNINDQGNNVSIGTNNNGSPLTINGATSIGSAFSTLAAPTNGLIVQGTTGIGTSSPFAKLSIHANNGDTNRVLFAVGSSTPTATSTLFYITNTGHRMGSSTSPVLSSCGTGPTMVGDDAHGEVTAGTTATGCTITFSQPYSIAPICTVTWQASPLASQSYAISGTAITLTQTSASNNKIDYVCEGLTGQ